MYKRECECGKTFKTENEYTYLCKSCKEHKEFVAECNRFGIDPEHPDATEQLYYEYEKLQDLEERGYYDF